MSIDLVPGRGMEVYDEPNYDLEGVWHAAFTGTSTFDVVVTNTGYALDDDLNLFISTRLHVVGYEGDDWDCWDVEGGIQCLNQDTVVHDEAWPTLHVEARQNFGWVPDDTLDAYGSSSTGDAHTGVPLWYASPGQ